MVKNIENIPNVQKKTWGFLMILIFFLSTFHQTAFSAIPFVNDTLEEKINWICENTEVGINFHIVYIDDNDMYQTRTCYSPSIGTDSDDIKDAWFDCQKEFKLMCNKHAREINRSQLTVSAFGSSASLRCSASSKSKNVN
jgi:hypothetical protein